MFSSRNDEEWIPATDQDRQAVLTHLERVTGAPADDGGFPGTEQDRQAVLAQLDRMLEDARFGFSRYYPRFLRFVVEKTVAGATDRLKERDLGVEIFGLSADYDSNADPIVPVTAAEIRDRIAQYYDQEEHSAELRIDLPHDSYIPRFRQAPAQVARVPDRIQVKMPAKLPIIPTGETKTSPIALESPGRSRLVGVVWALVFVILGLTAVIAFAVAKKGRVDAVTSFWQFGGDHPPTVMVCIREVEPYPGMSNAGIAGSGSAAPQQEGMIPYSDVVFATRITSAITSAGLTPLLRVTSRTSLNDLQQGPVVMVGAFDNDWTLRLTDSLPFRFVRPGNGGIYQILDARSAVPPVYSIDKSLPYSALTQDYGIVARFLNPLTERPTVIVAGLGANGTEAATSLVTSNDLLRQFVASAPKDWRKRNFELLLATQVIDGNVGPPKILAAQYW